MSGRALNGNEISDLPPEILNYEIKETPRSTLKDIANRLNAETVSTGNWETLAEKLGFLRSSVLDDMIEKAKVLHTYPGLLMLQDWACRPGSTAFVLLHALREIQREDVVDMLVKKLFELHTMQLAVGVEDRTGVHQFLQVRTRKSAPLHASLENTLQHPLYWYDIIGPQHNINWSTPSGQLQGAQLTLRLREEPSQESMNQIYGTTRAVCQPPSGHPPAFTQVSCWSQEIVGNKNLANPVNQLQMNIPPMQPNISVTIPLDPSAHRTQLNVRTEGAGVRLVSNLSSTERTTIERDPNVTHPTHLPLPPDSGSGSRSAARELDSRDPESVLNELQPLTMFSNYDSRSPAALPPVQDLSTTMPLSSVSRDNEFSTSPKNACGDSHMSCTVLKEMRATSYTETKLPVTDNHGGLYPSEHDEASTTDHRARSERENPDAVPAQHEEMDLVGGQQSPDREKPSPHTSTSSMNPEYVPHNWVIQFCNNPTSPQGCGSGSSVTACGVGTSDGRLAMEESSSHFLHQPQTPFQFSAAARQGCTSPPCSRKEHGADYVPHSFIEEQSKNVHKCASAPELDEEDHTQNEQSCAENSREPAERMDWMEEGQGFREGNENQASASSAVPASKPAPCTYTCYRPDMVDSRHHYLNTPRQRPLTHSVSVDGDLDAGYVDMSGSAHRAALSQQDWCQPSSMALLAMRNNPCKSVDSSCLNNSAPPRFYLPDDSTGCQSLDSAVRKTSSPELSQFFSPRARRPLPTGDIFGPRDRRPLTRDHDMLLDQPESDYHYIDPPSAALGHSNSGCALGGPASAPSFSSSAAPSTSQPGARADEGCVHRADWKRFAFRRHPTDNQLLQVPGWNPTVTDATVDQEMMKYINDDGNFIIWRYDGKFVISVSHLRSICHYKVHEKEQAGQLYYFIFTAGPFFTSLADLVHHCQKFGMAQHSQTKTKTKTFLTPDGSGETAAKPENSPAQGPAIDRRLGSGRFSHVRLKSPVPVRRH